MRSAISHLLFCLASPELVTLGIADTLRSLPATLGILLASALPWLPLPVPLPYTGSFFTELDQTWNIRDLNQYPHEMTALQVVATRAPQHRENIPSIRKETWKGN